MYAMYVTFTVESAPLLSEPVHKSDFSEHVKVMHKERDSGFEREYQVCMQLCFNLVSHVSTYISMHPHMNLYLFAYIINFCQTIDSIPDGVMDIAKAHRPKNRYLNIHTCESVYAVVYIVATNWLRSVRPLLAG